MSPDAPRDLLHPALESPEGVPLEQARLSDQQRLAVVLQGAALTAHLEHGGWYLPSGWETARVGRDARLTVGPAEPGRGLELPQVRLLELLRKLFRGAGETIAGRGEGRCAARRLLRFWRHFLAPLSADQAVAEVLEAAPFLWLPAFAAARTALVAEHRIDGTPHLWIAGPGWHRRRLLARASDRGGLAALLAGPTAADLWDGWRPDDDPVALARRGRHREALACWRRRPPRKGSEALLAARSFFVLGLFSRAHETLKGRRSPDARLLRLRCLAELGRLDAAQQMLYRLAKSELDSPRTLELAELAVRLLSLRGRHEQAREWVARAFQAAAGGGAARRARAELLAAEAAWDRGELETTARHLEAARPALADGELARRWQEVRGLLAMGRRDGPAVIEAYTAVLGRRRHLTRVEAGRHWGNLAYGRVLAGDLAGAERAVRHAQRLLSATESASRDTLGHYNLAEIRLRRGRLAGVVEALEASAAENRRTGNVRGQVADLELCVRLELVQGRPEAALARCAEARELIAEAGVGDRRIFDLFAARACGWLSRPRHAAASLARLTPELVTELEPEERPAVWALAGRLDQAAAEAAGTPWAALWSAHLGELQPRAGVWDELSRLEPFRAARLVFDSETLRPGVAPPAWIRRAVAGLRAAGADAFADRLERRSFSPWRAVESYLEAGRSGGAPLGELFAAAGYPETRLTYRHGGHEHVLVAGEGGESGHTAWHRGGQIVLEAPLIDDALRALVLLVLRDVEPPEATRERRSGAPSANGTIVGESAALKKALARLDQLARSELPVLIFGESGTGKELMAGRVHRSSARCDRPFEAVNCAALPEENLAQSELFGHLRGAFTGADRDRQGIFEKARGGTVFLDEIGDLPLPVQGKLLRVLQEGEIRRLGESFVRQVDVRVIAATHHDLPRMVEEGGFRRDLFFRLKGAVVELPPLRERGDDILLLADFLLDRYHRRHGSRQGSPPEISREARALLLRHGWPGNVRELRHTLESAALLADGREIRARDLGLGGERKKAPRGGYQLLVREYKGRLITEAMAKSGGNRAAAARVLGLTRQALSYLIRQLDLDFPSRPE